MVTTVKRLLAFVLLAASACSPDFPPQYRVTDLRILAVRSLVEGSPATADGDPPDTLVLSALVANPQARPGLRIVWRACFPIPGAAPPCLDDSILRDPSSLDGMRGVIGLGEGATVKVPLIRQDVDVPALMTALVLQAVADPRVACHMYLELPVVVTAEAGGRSETAVKTVRLAPWREAAGTSVAEAYTLNMNPGIQVLRLDPTNSDRCDGTEVARVCDSSCISGTCTPDPGGGLAQCLPAPGALPVGKHVLCGLQQDSASQSYQRCNDRNELYPVQESLTWQWYVTGGTIDDTSGVGNATRHHVTLERPAGPFTLWLILRDNRGGESWIQRDFPAAQ
jgi:hypothetical protein